MLLPVWTLADLGSNHVLSALGTCRKVEEGNAALLQLALFKVWDWGEGGTGHPHEHRT